MNLFSGREIMRRLKSQIQPKITFTSSGPASASNLLSAAISSLGIGSFSCFGRAAAWIARRVARASRFSLFVPGIATVRPVVSSIKTYVYPRGFIGMSTMRLLPSAKGMSSSRNFAFGTRREFGASKVSGSQSSCWRISVARSQMGSEKNAPFKRAGGAAKSQP